MPRYKFTYEIEIPEDEAFEMLNALATHPGVVACSVERVKPPLCDDPKCTNCRPKPVDMRKVFAAAPNADDYGEF